MYPGIKQEAIKVEDVPENDDEDNPPSLTERDSVPPVASLVIGNRVRVPRQMLIHTMKGKHHDEGLYEVVGFPHIKSIRVELEMDRIKNQFAGAGYSTKLGVINFRNLLSIDSLLNRIDPSTNIFPPNPERGYRTSRVTN